MTSKMVSTPHSVGVETNLRPLVAEQLYSWSGLTRQACKAALDHFLCMAVRQLHTRLDDAPTSPLGQDLALSCQVPRHRER